MTDIVDAARKIEKWAVISDCGRYRYSLTRKWGDGPLLPFVMLNPSTADAEQDDPTIRRCMGFARREGAAGIVVVNLYAFRSTSPEALWKVNDPIGPACGAWIVSAACKSQHLPVIAAWGAHTRAVIRARDITTVLGENIEKRLACLGKTKGGAPRHPLYVRADQPLEPFP